VGAAEAGTAFLPVPTFHPGTPSEVVAEAAAVAEASDKAPLQRLAIRQGRSASAAASLRTPKAWPSP